LGVTLKDVAQRAGVSPITVSRAFSGTHPVSDQTRQRVFEAARALDYAPDLLARGMVQKQMPIVGALVLDLANPFFVPIIDAVQSVAWDADYMLMVSQSEHSPVREMTSLDQFRQIRVAGILITPSTPEFGHLEQLRSQGTHVVVIARRWADGDYVTVDDVEGGCLVGEHLVELGHRRLVCVAHNLPDNTAVQHRVQGFQTLLTDAGLMASSETTIECETADVACAAQAVDEMLALPVRPSAVFVTADLLAIGIVHCLLERGVRVPDDVAVVGYDDIQYSRFLEVPLTTVALPKQAIGMHASQILFDRIRSGDLCEPYHQVSLQPELVVRKSCGAL
jgi:LacI family transcriptional regulator, galactose operon repressor